MHITCSRGGAVKEFLSDTYGALKQQAECACNFQRLGLKSAGTARSAGDEEVEAPQTCGTRKFHRCAG